VTDDHVEWNQPFIKAWRSFLVDTSLQARYPLRQTACCPVSQPLIKYLGIVPYIDRQRAHQEEMLDGTGERVRGSQLA
jgi:hypothetical protein